MDKSFLKYPLFLDDEIIEISRIIRESRLTDLAESFIKKSISENDKTVIHQATIKSCGATCVSMLLLEMSRDIRK
jgi:predicted double-glycine peptidase